MERELLSIVIPVYNETDTLNELYTRLNTVLSDENLNYEIIFVDDGSDDDTPDKLAKISKDNTRVRSIVLSRNFGHQLALTAGLDHTKGDVVIVMDGDLQHPPELIPKLVKKWREGYNIVYTVREETLDATVFKKYTSVVFYKLLKKLTNDLVKDNTADFRLMDRQAVDSLNAFRERFRFIRGLVSWIGFKQTSVTFKADSRFAGRSKYSIRKMTAFAIDAVTSFSTVPLRITFYIGILTSFLSFFYLLQILYLKFFTERAVQGWTSIMVLLLVLGGLQLSLMGVIGEYLGRVYEETKRRPLYIIKDKYND